MVFNMKNQSQCRFQLELQLDFCYKAALQLANDKRFLLVGKQIISLNWQFGIQRYIDLAKDCFGYHNPLRYFKILCCEYSL